MPNAGKTKMVKIDKIHIPYSQALAGTLFFALFLVMANSALSASVAVHLIFRTIVIPVYQWIVIFVFMLLMRYLAGRSWQDLLTRGALMGLIFCLYLPMLDTQRQVWAGVPLSRVYVWYINSFVFFVSLSLLVWGAIMLKSLTALRGNSGAGFFGDTIFFPISLLSLYGVVYFYNLSHRAEAVILFLAFLVSLHPALGRAIAAIMSSVKTRKAWHALTNTRTLVFLIFILALILRLVFLFNLLSIEGSNYPYASDDGDSYDKYGWQGVTDPMVFLRSSPHYFMVFYSVFLSAIYFVFGHSYPAAGIVQSVIGSLMCAGVFVLAYRITGVRAVAFLSSLGVCVNPALIHLTTTLNTEALYIPMIVAFIILLSLYRAAGSDAVSAVFAASAGFLLGLAAIVRQLALGIAPLAVIWILAWGREYRKHRMVGRVRDALLLFILMLAPILPITYTNFVNTRHFYLIYDTNRNSWNVTSPWGEELVPSNARLVKLGMDNPLHDPANSLKAVFTSPGEVAKALLYIIPRRMKDLFIWPNFGYFDPVFLINGSQLVNQYARHLEFYTILLYLASLGIFLFSNLRPADKTLIFLVIAYYTVFHGIFFLCHSPRYRAPMDPFLAIVVSFGVYKIFKIFRSANTKVAAGSLA